MVIVSANCTKLRDRHAQLLRTHHKRLASLALASSERDDRPNGRDRSPMDTDAKGDPAASSRKRTFAETSPGEQAIAAWVAVWWCVVW